MGENSELGENNELEQPKAYRGDGNFVFLSYSHHRDSDIIFAEIRSLQQKGLNVWYDEGLALGKNWDEDEVHRHILKKACVGVLFYASEESVKSGPCRKEVEYTIEAKKNFGVVLMDHNVTDTFALYKRMIKQCEDMFHSGRIDETTYGNLSKVFHIYNTYTAVSFPSHIDKIVGDLEAWKYYSERVRFPLCNVMHNGQVEYLPSLLSVTPFNYTYFVAALIDDESKHIRESMYEKGVFNGNGRIWEQYPYSEFISLEEKMNGKSYAGIIVCMDKENPVLMINKVLEKRLHIAYDIPLLVVLPIPSLSDSATVLSEARKQVAQWDNLNDDLKDDAGKYNFLNMFMSQTTTTINQTNCPTDEEERIRLYLGDREHYDALRDYAGRPDTKSIIDWLFMQEPASIGYSAFDDSRKRLKTDLTLCRQYDQIGFRFSEQYEED